ncbi:N-acetylglucosamine kinase-like BadF-type ATPase [Allocatelliglobosispora scoriae]|uniref:N-acetylglucosamine kinase-like BadF-type ATPase n=1 Tax=Allocatelliglobosispora scoriae TaxID=643052 RepID=A0A841C2X4_9ACTN|nr:BadF/BadG/BcrA/BcrD ATPase family protein [Allocatelliglobosispora scoriae]MBB5873310.1 N-acetylglucosamine kinase-like BadF-type ATPase [Allocatelliglobosispora scoriae]
MLVIGVDGGGTSTRCVAATLDGEIVTRSRAGGSNQRSSADPGESLREAIGLTLIAVEPESVVAGVVGLAGAGAAGLAAATALVTEVWESAGLPGRPVVTGDIEIAYAAGTDEPDGTVLIAGTGAVGARIAARRIAHRADGYGWLLGDEGSAVWIGRAAVAAVLAADDGRAAGTSLVKAIPELLGVSADAGLAQGIVRAAYAAPPAALGILSTVVEEAARAGDAVAWEILVGAADRLLRTANAVAGDGGPIVLAGGLLTAPTVVADLVRTGLADRRVVTAVDGAAGAAALALHELADAGTLAPDAAHQSHRRLLTR